MRRFSFGHVVTCTTSLENAEPSKTSGPSRRTRHMLSDKILVTAVALSWFGAACAPTIHRSVPAAAFDKVRNPIVDYHHHLLSPAGAALLAKEEPGKNYEPILAKDAITEMDAAGVQRAVILSDAYFFDGTESAA